MRVWADGARLPRALDDTTVVVAARGAAAGCARLLGAALVIPPGATGDVDTDLHAKARAAVDAIDARRAARRGPRRRARRGGPPPRRRRQGAGARGARRRAAGAAERRRRPRAGGTLAVCPDHGTDPLDGTHDAGAVPALRWGRGIAPAGPDRMTEAHSAGAPVRPATWPLHGAARLEAAA